MGTVPLARAETAQRIRLRRFKARLRLAAHARGFSTMNELAEASGVLPPTISRYMTGERLPSMPVCMKLADALGITVDWLCGYSPADTVNRAQEGMRIQMDVEQARKAVDGDSASRSVLGEGK